MRWKGVYIGEEKEKKGRRGKREIERQMREESPLSVGGLKYKFRELCCACVCIWVRGSHGAL